MQDAQGRAARGWRERDKRERVLGRSAENLYRWVWAGRTACVAGRPWETMLSRWVAGPCEGISNQLRSAGAALQRLQSLLSMNQKTALVGRPVVAVIGYSVLKLVDQIGVDEIGEAFHA